MNIGSHNGGCGHVCCLRIKDLSVKLGNDVILSNINLHAHCGEMIALIGPNGAGKTTLLKSILGQYPSDGIISFSVPGQRNRRPVIGYVPQSPSFDSGDPVSVADLFACCMGKRPAFMGLSKKMRQKVITCLERVNGSDLIDRLVGTLSGGELQRVLLALALEPVPNVLILDEPLSGVDVEGSEILMELLDKLRKEYDLSIIMTTHDFALLSRYADQVIVIDHTVVCQGTPNEVLCSDGFQKTFHIKGGASE